MIQYFQHLNSIHPLSPEATDGLLKVIRAKELRKGQVWLQEGAVCDKMTFVVKGLLKSYFETGSKEVIMQLVAQDQWSFAASSFFDQLPSMYSIRCVEQSIVIYICKPDVDLLLERYTELNRHFKFIAENQVRENEAHTRLLMLSLKERYESILAENSWMVQRGRISDRLLAAYLGMTANSLCGIKKR